MIAGFEVGNQQHFNKQKVGFYGKNCNKSHYEREREREIQRIYNQLSGTKKALLTCGRVLYLKIKKSSEISKSQFSLKPSSGLKIILKKI
jgi:hypothetical protein